MNKLKTYRISLLISLFIGVIIDLIFFSFVIVDFVSNIETVTIMDYVMYIICFVLLLALNITEIVNTFISFKTGSNFIKFLAYDASGDKNTPLFNFCIVATFFLVLGTIYLIIAKCNISIPLGSMNENVKSFIICFFILVIIDLIFIYLFQYFGKDDTSMKKKNK